MEAVVAEKAKIILVGGMDYNVPAELKERFEIVKHITQGSKYNMLPQADYVFVITQWANHNIVGQVKRECKIPVVWLQQGWASMKSELQKRSLLPPDPAPEAAPQTPAPVQAKEPVSTLGLSEAEIWKKYGEKMIEACRTMLKIGDKVTEKEMLDVLSMAGPPPDDCQLFLPKLQMFGIIAPTKGGLWRLASSEEEAYEEEPEEAAPAEKPVRKAKAFVAEDLRTASEDRLRRIPGTPALVTKLIAALPKGPYPTKKAIQREMRKYKEFAGLTDNQVRLAVDRAIEQKIVDDSHESLFIAHEDGMPLTIIERKATQDEPEVPKVLPPQSAFPMLAPPPPPQVVVAPSGMSREEVERKWCYVVGRVKDVRQRLSDILQHCRIEWMETNKVLVIFLPAALSNCHRFLESTENWGTVSRVVQEHFTRDTVLRFMLDNGLRT